MGTEAGSLRTAGIALLADAAAGLDAALSMEEAMHRLARFCCEQVADSCTVTLLADGSARHVASDHRDPAMRERVRAYVERWPPNLRAAGGIGDAAEHQRPTLIAPVTEAVLERFADGDAHRLRALRELEMGTICVVPLMARGRILGALGLSTLAGTQPLTPLDLPFLAGLTRRAALVLDNARLLDEAREAHATLHAVVQQAPLGVAVLDGGLRYRHVNPTLAAQNHLPPEAHLGRRPDELFADFLPAHVMAELQCVLDTGEPILRKHESMPTPSGDVRQFVTSYVPVATPDGPATGVGVLVEDVTERHRHDHERERILVAERSARLRLEEAHHRQGLLASVGAALEAGVGHEDGVHAVVRLLVDRGLADVAAVDVPLRDGRVRRMAAAARRPADDAAVRDAMRRTRFALDHPSHPVAVAVRTGQRQVVPIDDEVLRSVASGPEHLRALERVPAREGVCEPLLAAGRCVGVLSLAFGDLPSLLVVDAPLLEDISRRLALTLAAGAVQADREAVAAQLQEALLPPGLPEVPGVELAARHLPGAAGVDVGGDFYDVFAASAEGAWTVVIGDVCGKGAQAAVITAMARYTVRTLAVQRSDPADLLTGSNTGLLRQDDQLRFVTMIAARLQPTAGGAVVDLACAGHPPPVIGRADGTAEVVGVRGAMLGVRPDPVYLTEEVALGPGDALVLYTDGLTDQRGGTGATPQELAELTAGAAAEGPEAVVAALEARATRDGRLSDDLALLVISARRPAGR